MATWRSTTYREHLGENGNASPELSLAVDAGRVTRTLQIIPGDHLSVLQAARDFIGYAEVVEEFGTRYIRRITPHPFPPAPWLYCVSMPRTEGISFNGRDQDVATYKISKHTTIYESLTYNVRADEDVLGLNDLPDEGAALESGWENSRYVTKTSKPAAKLLILNRGTMQAVKADRENEAKPLMEGLPFVEPTAEVQYTWHGVPEAAVPNILHLTALGCLNDATFDRYPAETLQLREIDPGRLLRDTFGNRVHNVVYKMQFLPRIGWTLDQTGMRDGATWNSFPLDERVAPTARGHNWIWDFKNGEFIVVRVTSNGLATGQPPYFKLDFKKLFRPDQP